MYSKYKCIHLGYSGSDLTKLVEKVLRVSLSKVHTSNYFVGFPIQLDGQTQYGVKPCSKGTKHCIKITYSDIQSQGYQVYPDKFSYDDFKQALKIIRASVTEEELDKIADFQYEQS